MKTEFIRARIEPELKTEVHHIFTELGVTPTQVITMLYKQVKHLHRIPIELALPNAETRQAIEEARKGIGVKEYKSVKAFSRKINNVKNKSKKQI